MAIELHLLPIEILPIQPRQQHVPVPKLALERQIVDGEDGCDLLVLGNAAVFGREIRGQQAGLPIVAVQDVEVEIQQPHGFHHRPAEEHKPLAVVDVVFAAFAIEPGPVVILVLLDQVDRAPPPGNLLSSS